MLMTYLGSDNDVSIDSNQVLVCVEYGSDPIGQPATDFQDILLLFTFSAP